MTTVAFAAMLGFSASAFAATATTGFFGDVEYTAAAGETNTLSVTVSPANAALVRLHDTVAVTASGGCTQIDPNTADCTPGGLFCDTVGATLGDMPDTATFGDGLPLGGCFFGAPVSASGGDGVDHLNGGNGGENFDGDAGDDVLAGGAGFDSLNGGDGADNLTGGDDGDSLSGDAGNDTEDGGAGDDDFFQGAAADGADTVIGGADENDTVNYFARTNNVTVSLADPAAGATEPATDGESGEGDTVRSDVENATGGAGNDTLVGNARPNGIGAGDGNDQVDGGNGDFSDGDGLSGDDGNDAITGNDGDDIANGGLGDDNLQGGDGDDFLVGGAVGPLAPADTDNDTMDGGADDDVLNGQTGNDTEAGGAGFDNISGSDGDDTLNGGLDGDSINGGSGTDTMNGESGNDGVTDGDFAPDDVNADTADGGIGEDRINYSSRDTPVVVNLGVETGNGEAAENDTLRNFEDVSGGSDDDTLTGNASDNDMDGNDGNDVISSGDGDDFVDGEDGADTLNAGEGDNELDGGINDDSLTSGGGQDSLFGEDGDDVMHAGGGRDFLSGGRGADTMDGEGGGEDTVGYGGADGPVTADLDGVRDDGEEGENDQILNTENLDGGFADDLLTGNDGPNTIDGESGNDTINGAGGNDELFGSSNRDRVNGGVGNDALFGDSGRDLLSGDAGKDRLDGGAGSDGMAGGPDEDTVDYSGRFEAVNVTIGNGQADDGAAGNEGDNVLGDIENAVAGDGDDTLVGNDGPNVLAGGVGDDTLNGGAGGDQLQGGANEDNLDGGAGDDVVEGGTGGDALAGGAGGDSMDSRDNRRDTVDCGSGSDDVNGDRRDSYKGCEVVSTGQGPKAKIKSKKATVDNTGHFTVKVKCPKSAGVCTGNLRFFKKKQQLASGSFEIPGGKKQAVDAELTKAGHDAVDGGSVRASARCVARNAAGEAGVTTKKVKLVG